MVGLFAPVVGRRAGQYIEPMPVPRAALQSALLPTQCAVCRGWSLARLCADCLRRHAGPVARCTRCALAVPAGATVCGACLQAPPPFARSIAAVDYAFPWSDLVSAFKSRSALDLAPALASLVAGAVQASDAPPVALIVPVPLGRTRLAERGMNQAWELARRVAATLAIDAAPQLLQRLIDTTHLAALPRAQRMARIRGAFAVAPGQARRLHGLRVALVDDVMTSGATAAEASRVLLAGGASDVQVWVLARTPAPGS
jgi:ComF family protein